VKKKTNPENHRKENKYSSGINKTERSNKADQALNNGTKEINAPQ
jgi:hypothetical protein